MKFMLGCNKIYMLEMVRFCIELCKSYQIKWQDGLRGCTGEGDHDRLGVAMVLFAIGLRRQKLSWC